MAARGGGMKTLSSVLLAGLLLEAAAGPSALLREMKRLGINTVLVLPSSAIDDYPVWSPDSRYVCANVMDHWKKVDLGAVVLTAGKWHDDTVGVTKSPKFVSP